MSHNVRGSPPPRIDGFNSVVAVEQLRGSVSSWLIEQFRASLPEPRSPNARATARLMQFEDIDDWLGNIVDAIADAPAFAVRTLEGKLIENLGPKPRARTSILALHQEQSWFDVLRYILVTVEQMLDETWVTDRSTANRVKGNLQELKSQFPEVPIFFNGVRFQESNETSRVTS